MAASSSGGFLCLKLRNHVSFIRRVHSRESLRRIPKKRHSEEWQRFDPRTVARRVRSQALPSLSFASSPYVLSFFGAIVSLLLLIRFSPNHLVANYSIELLIREVCELISWLMGCVKTGAKVPRIESLKVRNGWDKGEIFAVLNFSLLFQHVVSIIVVE